MAKAGSHNRVVLQLDPRIALEAIILNRFERIPKARRQEWLRGLLVQGFRIECRVLRDTAVVNKSKSRMKFSDWLAGDSAMQSALPKLKREQRPTAPTEVEATHNATKPFAQLSRIIG